MNRTTPTLTRVAGLAVAGAALLLAAGCGGGSSAPAITDPGLTGGFSPSGMSAAGDTVRLRGSSVEDLVTVTVAIGGPTTSSDLYSFAFDLVLGNIGVVDFVEGSAVFGSALTTGGSQSPQVLASQNGNRVTVGVTKLGGGAGNGVTAGEPAIVSLTFRVIAPGSSTIRLDGGPSSDPAALDSAGNPIPSVTFDLQPAFVTGS